MYKKLLKSHITKVITLTSLLVLLSVVVVNAKTTTLYDCYQSQGMGWPSVQDRAESGVPATYGIWSYTGTADQNILLAERLCPVVEEGMLGYSVATGYEKNLRVSMNATQSYVPVTSFELKDGTTLAMSDLGDKVFLTVEPGTSREEIVLCTTMGTTATNFETCTRGLAFSGTSEAAVSANRKAHNAGSKVVMSNVHYVYDQLIDKDTAETVGGAWTFTSPTSSVFYVFPTVSSSAYTGLPTANGEMATKYYVDTVGAGGFTSVNVSTTQGILVNGTSPETLGVNASSTTGMGFDSSDGSLYQKITFDSIIVDINDDDWTVTGTLAMPVDTYVTTTFTATMQGYVTLYAISNTSTIPAVILGVLDRMAVLSDGAITGIEATGLGNGRIRTPEFGSILYSETDGMGVDTDILVTQIATSTPTASSIPIADVSGKLANGWLYGEFGDGADGALSVPSGTTTIDASSTNVVEKNYTSINISVGATLDISNKAVSGTILWLKSQGDVTISGTIDLLRNGADGGVGESINGFNAFSLNTNNGAGTGGQAGDTFSSSDGDGGGGGASVNGGGSNGVIVNSGTGSSGGSADGRITTSNLYRITSNLYLAVGAGGGSGGRENDKGGSSGSGGTGGGTVIIQVGGELIFDGVIDVSGGDGGDASSGVEGDHGGGGGGGGGVVILLAKTITTNSGTLTVNGGALGAGLGGGGDGGAGADGYSLVTEI